MKRYKPLFEKHYIITKFEEALRFSDLQKHSGLSDRGQKFRKQRNKSVGQEVQVAKLIDIKFDDNDITFQFLTEPGSKNPMETNPKSDFALKPTNEYLMEFKIIDFFEYIKGETVSVEYLKEIIRAADIQLYCSCPAFQYQGSNYILTTFDASIYPENRPPSHWKDYHDDNNFVCKHLSGMISGIMGFYINPMTSMLNKKLKEKGFI